MAEAGVEEGVLGKGEGGINTPWKQAGAEPVVGQGGDRI